MEEALHDTPLYCQFAGLDAGITRLPDESTILRFRHLLEEHNLSIQLMATIHATLATKGLILKTGTVVDATLVAAPSSTKNSRGERDPEMHQTKNGNQCHFGMKAHIGVDVDSGQVHTVMVSSSRCVTRFSNIARHQRRKPRCSQCSNTGNAACTGYACVWLKRAWDLDRSTPCCAANRHGR